MLPGSFRIINRHKNLARQSGMADKRHDDFLFSPSCDLMLPRISNRSLSFRIYFDIMGILLCVWVYPSGTEKSDLSRDFFSIFFRVVVEVPFMIFMTI